MEHKDFTEFQIYQVKDDLIALKTQKSTKELLKAIKDSIEETYYEDPFEMFDFFS